MFSRTRPFARPTPTRASAVAGALLCGMLSGCAVLDDVPATGFPPPPQFTASPAPDHFTTSPAPDHAPGEPAAGPGQPEGGAPGTGASQSGQASEAAGPLVDIRAQLDGLAVKGRAPKTGYDRNLFGQRWSDDVPVALGHNGCDTRNDILRRDLVDVAIKPNTNDCVALAGTLHDPYTGAAIAFQRGSATSSAVQIDHVVAMSDAWQKGAQGLDEDTRRAFANDPLNLLAVDGPSNQRKGDGDAATWLPPNSAFRCQYVARQVAVKHRYGLWVTAAERDAMDRWLGTCTPADDASLAALVEGGAAERR